MTLLRSVPVALLSATALLLAGCSQPTTPAVPPPSGPASTADHDHDGEPAHDYGTETTEASPRIVVSTEAGITVLDDHLHELASFPTSSRPSLTAAHDGRHVLAVESDRNLVNVLDAGSWAAGHGDHFHFFVADPALAEEPLEGSKPIHVVPHAASDSTAVFFDDDGAATLLDDHVLASGHGDEAARVTTKGPHHGLVLPWLDGQRLVTQPGDEGPLPDTVELQDGEGHVLQSFPCADLHGEAVSGETAAFGCLDSVLLVRDGAPIVIPAPDASGERVGGLVAFPDGGGFVGDWGPETLVFIRDDKATVVDVGITYGARAVTPDGRVAVLGTDGGLRLFDDAGTLLQSVPVTGAWELPKGHGGVVPSIQAGLLAAANTVWVTDPAAGKVHAVDLFANHVTSADVAGQPSSIAVTNAG